MGIFGENKGVGTYRDESNRGCFASAGMKTEQDPNSQINHNTPGAGGGGGGGDESSGWSRGPGNNVWEAGPGYVPNPRTHDPHSES
jgi:hypothetical protein